MTCQHLFQLHWPSIRIHLHWPELSHKIDFACDGLDECFSLNLPTCALTHARQPLNNIKTASSVEADLSSKSKGGTVTGQGRLAWLYIRNDDSSYIV